MSSALTAEQLTLYNTLKDMGMDISLAKEAASMSLDAELAILFCTDEDVQHRERENHRAAVLLNQTTRGTRSSGARHAVSSLREPLNNRSDRVQDLLGNKGMGSKSSMALVRRSADDGGPSDGDEDNAPPPGRLPSQTKSVSLKPAAAKERAAPAAAPPLTAAQAATVPAAQLAQLAHIENRAIAKYIKKLQGALAALPDAVTRMDTAVATLREVITHFTKQEQSELFQRLQSPPDAPATAADAAPANATVAASAAGPATVAASTTTVAVEAAAAGSCMGAMGLTGSGAGASMCAGMAGMGCGMRGPGMVAAQMGGMGGMGCGMMGSGMGGGMGTGMGGMGTFASAMGGTPQQRMLMQMLGQSGGGARGGGSGGMAGQMGGGMPGQMGGGVMGGAPMGGGMMGGGMMGGGMMGGGMMGGQMMGGAPMGGGVMGGGMMGGGMMVGGMGMGGSGANQTRSEHPPHRLPSGSAARSLSAMPAAMPAAIRERIAPLRVLQPPLPGAATSASFCSTTVSIAASTADDDDLVVAGSDCDDDELPLNGSRSRSKFSPPAPIAASAPTRTSTTAPMSQAGQYHEEIPGSGEPKQVAASPRKRPMMANDGGSECMRQRVGDDPGRDSEIQGDTGRCSGSGCMRQRVGDDPGMSISLLIKDMTGKTITVQVHEKDTVITADDR